MLHITNGDCAVAVLSQEEPAFLGDTTLAWYVERIGRGLPRWLGGCEVKDDETVRWDPALSRLIRT